MFPVMSTERPPIIPTDFDIKQNTLTKAAYIRKHLIKKPSLFLRVSLLWPWQAGSLLLIPRQQAEGVGVGERVETELREKETGWAWCGLLNPHNLPTSNIPIPTRPHPLVLIKQSTNWEPNIQTGACKVILVQTPSCSKPVLSCFWLILLPLSQGQLPVTASELCLLTVSDGWFPRTCMTAQSLLSPLDSHLHVPRLCV